MGIKIEKLADLEYNEIVTLGVIEQDSVLSSIFLEDVKMSFNMVKLLSKENNLNEFSKLKIYEFFDKIILTNKNYIDKYSYKECPIIFVECWTKIFCFFLNLFFFYFLCCTFY